MLFKFWQNNSQSPKFVCCCCEQLKRTFLHSYLSLSLLVLTKSINRCLPLFATCLSSSQEFDFVQRDSLFFLVFSAFIPTQRIHHKFCFLFETASLYCCLNANHDVSVQNALSSRHFIPGSTS